MSLYNRIDYRPSSLSPTEKPALLHSQEKYSSQRISTYSVDRNDRNSGIDLRMRELDLEAQIAAQREDINNRDDHIRKLEQDLMELHNRMKRTDEILHGSDPALLIQENERMHVQIRRLQEQTDAMNARERESLRRMEELEQQTRILQMSEKDNAQLRQIRIEAERNNEKLNLENRSLREENARYKVVIEQRKRETELIQQDYKRSEQDNSALQRDIRDMERKLRVEEENNKKVISRELQDARSLAQQKVQEVINIENQLRRSEEHIVTLERRLEQEVTGIDAIQRKHRQDAAEKELEQMRVDIIQLQSQVHSSKERESRVQTDSATLVHEINRAQSILVRCIIEVLSGQVERKEEQGYEKSDIDMSDKRKYKQSSSNSVMSDIHPAPDTISLSSIPPISNDSLSLCTKGLSERIRDCLIRLHELSIQKKQSETTSVKLKMRVNEAEGLNADLQKRIHELEAELEELQKNILQKESQTSEQQRQSREIQLQLQKAQKDSQQRIQYIRNVTKRVSLSVDSQSNKSYLFDERDDKRLKTNKRSSNIGLLGTNDEYNNSSYQNISEEQWERNKQELDEQIQKLIQSRDQLRQTLLQLQETQKDTEIQQQEQNDRMNEMQQRYESEIRQKEMQFASELQNQQSRLEQSFQDREEELINSLHQAQEELNNIKAHEQDALSENNRMGIAKETLASEMNQMRAFAGHILASAKLLARSLRAYRHRYEDVCFQKRFLTQSLSKYQSAQRGVNDILQTVCAEFDINSPSNEQIRITGLKNVIDQSRIYNEDTQNGFNDNYSDSMKGKSLILFPPPLPPPFSQGQSSSSSNNRINSQSPYSKVDQLNNQQYQFTSSHIINRDSSPSSLNYSKHSLSPSIHEQDQDNKQSSALTNIVAPLPLIIRFRRAGIVVLAANRLLKGLLTIGQDYGFCIIQGHRRLFLTNSDLINDDPEIPPVGGEDQDFQYTEQIDANYDEQKDKDKLKRRNNSNKGIQQEQENEQQRKQSRQRQRAYEMLSGDALLRVVNNFDPSSQYEEEYKPQGLQQTFPYPVSPLFIDLMTYGMKSDQLIRYTSQSPSNSNSPPKILQTPIQYQSLQYTDSDKQQQKRSTSPYIGANSKSNSGMKSQYKSIQHSQSQPSYGGLSSFDINSTSSASKKACAVITQMLRDSNRECNELRRRVAQAEDQASSAGRIISTLETNLGKTKELVEVLESRVRTLQSEQDHQASTNETNGRLQYENRQLEEQINMREADVDKLKKRLDNQSTVLTDAQLKIEQMQRDVDAHKRSHSDQQKEIDSLKKEVQNQKDKEEQAKREYQKLNQEINRLRSQLNDAETRESRVQQDIIIQKQTTKEIQLTAGEANNKIHELSQKLQNAETVRIGLEKRLNQSVEDATRRQKEFDDTVKRLESSTKELKLVQSRCAELEQILQNARSEIISLQRELEFRDERARYEKEEQVRWTRERISKLTVRSEEEQEIAESIESKF